MKVAAQERMAMASCKHRNVFRRSRVRTTLFLMALSFVMLGTVLLVSLARILSKTDDHEVHVVYLDHPVPVQNLVPSNTAELLARLKATTSEAANGSESFPPSTRSRWHKQHPCASRYEIYKLYEHRKSTHDTETNPKWENVLREYTKLHRTCVAKMGDVDEFFLKRKHIPGCRFVVAGVSAGSGIGNKALSIVSALLYAVLTQRVLLVPLVSAVTGVFCEPFEGSSWMVDPDMKWTESKKRKDLWKPVQSFYAKVDSRRDTKTMIQPLYAVATTENWDAQPEPRFFCDTEQAQYTQVDWINFRNSLYFVPKLFAVPSFRPVLEDLFPSRKVFTPLLRTVMLPRDVVWGRVKQVHDAHFRHAHRRVGVQERYFNGKPDFDLLHKVTEENVAKCLLQHGWLPKNRDRELALPPPMAPLKVTTVFITSLYQSLFNRFTQDYIHVALQSGDAVGLVQLTHEDTQSFGVEVDRQALTEILCLSLTDHLILTPQSTFGALAQGYGGLVPWFVDLRPDTSTPCVRAQSKETCFQIPASKLYTCPHDVAVNGKPMTDLVPYLSDCHSVEEPFVKVNGAGLGLQLITS